MNRLEIEAEELEAEIDEQELTGAPEEQRRRRVALLRAHISEMKGLKRVTIISSSNPEKEKDD